MADLSAVAAADLAWLKAKLGASRVQGPTKDGSDWTVVLTRSTGKPVHYFHRSPEKVLADAVADVRRAAAQRSAP